MIIFSSLRQYQEACINKCYTKSTYIDSPCTLPNVLDLVMRFPFHRESITTNNQLLIRLNCQLAKLTRSYQNSDALKLFNQIHSSYHLKPDHYTLSTTLTACANLRDTAAGDQLHAHAIRAGFKAFPHVGNTLLSLYAKAEDLNSVNRVFSEIATPDVYSWTTVLSFYTKLGHIDYAWHLFDLMPQRNVAVWNAIITGCVENGYGGIAFDMFQEMHESGMRHDNYTFASVLSLCCSTELLGFGRQVHSLVIRTGFLVRVSVVNALLTMYFNCGIVRDAYEVFEEAEATMHDQITFNAMIAGLVSRGRDVEALIMFREMQEACLEPTTLTFVSILSSCPSARIGHQVHAQAIKMGFEACTSVSNAAITMYSNCGDLGAAHMVFDRLEEKDLVSWNTMITGYTQGNNFRSAILAYLQMQWAGVEPDDFTVGSLLAYSEFVGIVEMIQALVTKNGLVLSIQVNNALVSAFCKHGKIEHAYRIFGDMSKRNLISWNTIISGCLFNGLPLQGLEIFCDLQMSKLRPGMYTLSIVLSICASISALRHGKQAHGYILRSGFGSETSLGNALVTMYAKCGVLHWSSKVFFGMMERDTVSWNAMISAYAQHGEGKEAVQCFEVMQESGNAEPDQATFTAVLSACSHAGLVDDGTRIFSSMVDDYRVEPGVDHYSCIIDLLGRAGHLDEAERLINSMPFQADSSIWWALLSACTAHGNVRLGRIAAEFLLETEPNNPAVYVLLSNINAAAGQWEEAANVREQMSRTGMMKQPGCSWIRS
ncbi:hypothetical protein HHK36_009719 [Tetracentron sinense]|uniref:Uncharacterized protein n=1 Tax=Tetracentron sinense TaxID=13715 RepID=A0A834ZG50_TETSI|nr:hypothetical protein HHK36_009719 [Tetracentron sinense]